MEDKQEQILLARMQEACDNNYAPRFFDFLDQAAQATLTPFLSASGEPFVFYGGMPEAERKLLCVYPEYVAEEDIAWPLMAAQFDKTFDFEHRHVLGELMGMGIERSCVGDIYVGEDAVQVIFLSRMADFFRLNFNKVRGRTIKPRFVTLPDIWDVRPAFQTISVVAASQRLDGVIGKIWGLSRADSLSAIRAHNVRVNYLEATKPDYQLAPGDVVSLRGKGKAVIASLEGTTKKGRLRLLVKKYV